ncbi:unnamed protein product [Hyaloperonospora brassicae]|uniref:RxLR effector candidate protein n=1 Tax=Hyaloperonospora brassicae TaxID=162125 RepID=A0AAV0TC02_HYABA|nr:unnamed protein product [Hyaloperonospora brassicae]
MTKWLLLLHLALVLSSCSGGATSPAFEKLSELTSPDENQATPPDVTGDGNALRAATVPVDGPRADRGSERLAGFIGRLTGRAKKYLPFKSKKIAPVVDLPLDDTKTAVAVIDRYRIQNDQFPALDCFNINPSTYRTALKQSEKTGGHSDSTVDTLVNEYTTFRKFAAAHRSKKVKNPYLRPRTRENVVKLTAMDSAKIVASPGSGRESPRSALKGTSPRSSPDSASPRRVRFATPPYSANKNAPSRSGHQPTSPGSVKGGASPRSPLDVHPSPTFFDPASRFIINKSPRPHAAQDAKAKREAEMNGPLEELQRMKSPFVKTVKPRSNRSL